MEALNDLYKKLKTSKTITELVNEIDVFVKTSQ